MNLTLHLIRKDLRTLRWLLVLWVLACLTHLGLRIAQDIRGEGAAPNGFWLNLESSDRWDYLAVAFLPVLLIPILLQLDPLRGPLAFWKSVPISGKRLFTAKIVTLAVFFVLLPLVCEIVYFTRAGLASVLPTAIGDWALRYLPGVVAAFLGCIFARSWKWSVPCAGALVFLAFVFGGWPMGVDRDAPLRVTRTAPQSPTIDMPPGVRATVDPKSFQFNRTRFMPSNIPGGSDKPEERMAVGVELRIDGLPEDMVVRAIVVNASSVELAGRVMKTTGSPMFLTSPYDAQLPAQEQRSDLGRQDFANRDLPRNIWNAQTEYFPFSTKDLDPKGTPVEGKLLVSLSRKRRIAELPLVNGAEWRPGLHRLALWDVSPADSSRIGFRATLTTVLADPRGSSGGLNLLPSTSIAMWVENQSLPLRKYLQSVPSSVWRSTGFRGQPYYLSSSQFVNINQAFITDLTRSRKRLNVVPSFDPIEVVRNQQTPLSVARFAEEQAQVRNWRLALIAYDEVGTIEVPFKAVVPPPPVAREDSDPNELKPPVPPLSELLGKIDVPKNPEPGAAAKLMQQIAEVSSTRSENSMVQNEPTLYAKLGTLARSDMEALLSAATAAHPAREYGESQPRFRNEWLLKEPPSPNAFWRRVLNVACDTARPEDKALFLQYHSPRVDLLRAIEPNGWLPEALPTMCSIAAGERVPATWVDMFARSRDPRASEAMLAQIRLRSLSVSRVAKLIESGAIPAREAASALWETAVRNTGNLSDLRTAFTVATKYGVEIAPRDALRILRMRSEDITHFGGLSLKVIQASFIQSLSLRSDCPPDVAKAAVWLEQNAPFLQFNAANGRYELPGQAAPRPQFGSWGTLRDPRGLGNASVENGDLIMIAGGAAPTGVTENVRFTREVEGDFTVEVTVQPQFDLAPAWTRTEADIFQTAGLLVFDKEERWLRWEHCVYKNAEGHQLREETMRGGKNKVIQRATKSWDRNKPLRLRITRHGDLFATAWNQGGDWVESPALMNIGWSRKLQVGPWVGNHVSKMFSARFSDYKLTPSSPAPANPELAVGSHPEGEATPAGTDLGPWGKVENPIGAGVFKVEGNALSISVAPRVADYNLQQRMTAPRAVQEVDGDFTLEATITPTAKKYWNSAELLIASGFDFYLRIGLAMNNGSKPHFTYDYARNGSPSSVSHIAQPADLTKPVRLRLQRRGWMLTIAHQQEGGDWKEFYPLNLRGWPQKVQVGVMALNTSSEPFTAQFSDLKLERGQSAR